MFTESLTTVCRQKIFAGAILKMAGREEKAAGSPN